MSMTGRCLTLSVLVLALAVLLAVACGGGDDGGRVAGRLTDPRTVPTATPWSDAPEAIILEPGALTPISEDGTEENGDGGEVGEGVTPVTPFQVTVADSANIRAEPTTESDIVAILSAGNEESVIGQISGEMVEEGNDIWYQLEDGSFVYSGTVTEVEE